MTQQLAYLVIAVVVLVVLFRILRAGRIREKYAALWILIGLAIVVLAVWPGLLELAARFLGIQVGSNLLFFLALLLLTAVSLHLSLEVSGLEEESRVLAEEVALMSERLGRLEDARADNLDGRADDRSPHDRVPGDPPLGAGGPGASQ